jgi:hypothetical protein
MGLRVAELKLKARAMYDGAAYWRQEAHFTPDTSQREEYLSRAAALDKSGDFVMQTAMRLNESND